MTGAILSRLNREEQTIGLLRRYIRQRFSPGDILPSIRALADEIGVSLNTVSGALHHLAQAGHLHIRHGAGSRVTEAAFRPRIGVVASGDIIHPQSPQYGNRVMYHAVRLLQSENLDGVLYSGYCEPWDFDARKVPSHFLQDIRACNLEGIIAVTSPGPSWMEMCETLRIPVVGTTDAFPWHVDRDFEGLVRQGTRILLEAGRRRLALFSWDKHLAKHAFCDELAAAGVEAVPKWIQVGTHPCRTGSGWEGFRELWAASRVKPDGILIADDMFFSDVAMAIRELRIPVPDQLQVVTHANRDSHSVFYPFPVIILENNAEDHARALVDLLMVQLRNESPEGTHIQLGFKQRHIAANSSKWDSAATSPKRNVEW